MPVFMNNLFHKEEMLIPVKLLQMGILSHNEVRDYAEGVKCALVPSQCCNCGAPVELPRCSYCGTRYY
jgi:hypothetical protein